MLEPALVHTHVASSDQRPFPLFYLTNSLSSSGSRWPTSRKLYLLPPHSPALTAPSITLLECRHSGPYLFASILVFQPLPKALLIKVWPMHPRCGPLPGISGVLQTHSIRADFANKVSLTLMHFRLGEELLSQAMDFRVRKVESYLSSELSTGPSTEWILCKCLLNQSEYVISSDSHNNLLRYELLSLCYRCKNWG